MSIFLFGVDKALSLVKENKEESLGRLLSRNPRLVHDRDRNGNTCLLIAALYNRLEIGLLLLLRGADINAASGKADRVENDGVRPLNIELCAGTLQKTNVVGSVMSDEYGTAGKLQKCREHRF
jgi:ankyrin repeat protein